MEFSDIYRQKKAENINVRLKVSYQAESSLLWYPDFTSYLPWPDLDLLLWHILQSKVILQFFISWSVNRAYMFS